MVTLITEKLQDQTLEETFATKSIFGEQPKTKSKDSSTFDAIGKVSRVQRRRALTNRDTTNDMYIHIQDGSKLGDLASSFLNPTRCHSYPPAKKRLCRSLSDPFKEYGGKASWIPEPSSIWTPVRPGKSERTKASTRARSLDFRTRETLSWSTPPESPIPRPVSANSTVEDSKFIPLRFINEERDLNQIETVVKSAESGECCNLSTTMPRRSHSHPSFLHLSNSGLKRRLSEIDIPRPALDFDKMKARSLSNKSVDKRSLKSPKYTSKRYPPESPMNISTAKQEKNMLTATVPEDLGLSLPITPTASPTTEQKVIKNLTVHKAGNQDENANRKPADWNSVTTDSIMSDMELDIKLIEEDGTLNDPTHTVYFT